MDPFMRVFQLAVILTALTIPPPEAQPQAADDLEPRLFGEGVFTTGAYDFFVALTPDQKTA